MFMNQGLLHLFLQCFLNTRHRKRVTAVVSEWSCPIRREFGWAERNVIRRYCYNHEIFEDPQDWLTLLSLFFFGDNDDVDHTLYLSFFLHGQNFWRIKFTPKNANFSR